MVSKRKLEEKARIEADMKLRQRHFNEWHAIYKNVLKRLISINKSNQKIIKNIYE